MDITCGLGVKKPKNPILWSGDADSAFLMLKQLLAEDILLSYPDISQPVVLVTDASDFAI